MMKGRTMMRRAALACLLLFLLCVFACCRSCLPAIAQGRPDLVWMRGHHASAVVRVIAYSPDGKLIASGSGYDDGWDFTARIWRVSDGMLLRTFNHTGWVTSLAFTPDSKGLLAADTAGVVEYRRVSDGALLQSWKRFGGAVLSIAASPTGETFATGTSDGNAQLWRLSDGALLTTIKAHKGDVASVAFSSNGQWLATGCGLTPEGNDSIVKIWRVVDGALLKSFQGPTTIGNQGFQVTFSSDNARLLLAARGDNDSSTPVLWVWRIVDGALLQSSYRPGNRVDNVAFAPDGQFAVVTKTTYGRFSNGTAIDCWRLSDANILWSQPGVNYATLSLDGKSVALYDNGDRADIGQIATLNASDGTLDHNLIFPGENHPINLFTLSPDGKTTATVAGHQILLRSASDGTALRRIPTDFGFSSIAFSPDSTLIAGRYYGDFGNQNGGYASIWRVSDGTMLQTTIKGIDINSVGLTFSPDGKNLFIGNGKIHVYRIADGVLLQSFGSDGRLTFSSNGKYLLSTDLGGANLYRTSDWSLVRRFVPLDFRYVLSTAFSADSTMLAVAGGQLSDRNSDNSGTDIFDVSTGEKRFYIPANLAVTSCAFSPDGNVLMLGSGDAKLSFWSTLDASPLISYTDETGRPEFNGFGVVGGITKVIYSPEGKFIYYSREDGGLCAALNPYRNAIFPNKGGNTGNVTVKIITPDTFPLQSGATVKLTADGQPDIIALGTTLDSNTNYVMGATFALNGALLGQRNVIITNPDGSSRTYPQNFTIEQGVAPYLYIEILGMPFLRSGSESIFSLICGNVGNTDADSFTAWLRFSPVLTWQALGFDKDLIPWDADAAGSIISFDFTSVPALGSTFLRFATGLMEIPGHTFTIDAWTTPR